MNGFIERFQKLPTHVQDLLVATLQHMVSSCSEEWLKRQQAEITDLEKQIEGTERFRRILGRESGEIGRIVSAIVGEDLDDLSFAGLKELLEGRKAHVENEIAVLEPKHRKDTLESRRRVVADRIRRRDLAKKYLDLIKEVRVAVTNT